MKNLKNKLVFTLALIFCVTVSFSQSNSNSSLEKLDEEVVYVIVQHDVADYIIWEIAYKKDEERRKKSGINEKLLLRNIENTNSITVVFKLKNIDKAKAFFADPNSAKLMQAAGVISKPKFTYFKQ